MIGDKIKELRKDKGWTQEELANRMGYKSKSTINKIELNINDVSQDKIKRFADVLGCDVTEFFVVDPITKEEMSIIHKYRNLSDEDKKLVNRLLAYGEGLKNEH